MDAVRAAREIVAATKRGQAETILSLPAKLLSLGHGIFPGTTADALGWVNRWILPAGNGSREVRGRDVELLRTRLMKALTFLGRRMEADLHQTL